MTVILQKSQSAKLCSSMEPSWIECPMINLPRPVPICQGWDWASRCQKTGHSALTYVKPKQGMCRNGGIFPQLNTSWPETFSWPDLGAPSQEAAQPRPGVAGSQSGCHSPSQERCHSPSQEKMFRLRGVQQGTGRGNIPSWSDTFPI